MGWLKKAHLINVAEGEMLRPGHRTGSGRLVVIFTMSGARSKTVRRGVSDRETIHLGTRRRPTYVESFAGLGSLAEGGAN